MRTLYPQLIRIDVGVATPDCPSVVDNGTGSAALICFGHTDSQHVCVITRAGRLLKFNIRNGRLQAQVSLRIQLC